MRHRKAKITLDRKSAGRVALVKSLVISVVVHGKIITTETKAKAIRPVVERLVTHAKQDSVTNRRYIMQRIANTEAMEKLIKTWGPKYATRPGGYTRLIRLPQRVGDGAKRAMIEFV